MEKPKTKLYHYLRRDIWQADWIQLSERETKVNGIPTFKVQCTTSQPKKAREIGKELNASVSIADERKNIWQLSWNVSRPDSEWW